MPVYGCIVNPAFSDSTLTCTETKCFLLNLSIKCLRLKEISFIPSAMFKTQMLIGQRKSMDINESNVTLKKSELVKGNSVSYILQTTAQDANSRDLREPHASPALSTTLPPRCIFLRDNFKQEPIKGSYFK